MQFQTAFIRLTNTINKQSKAKQSKAKQSKAKQSKAKQSKAKQSKAKHGLRGNTTVTWLL
ncbi:hypothetical protein [Aeromonas veronii]|uniref:hypothetical protein n=1 Tax=Aeromonas veronii TaxID=654 RepID=UPI001F2A85BB|nr:hypothetical protein [Aeromonas veronii]MCF5899643.1 hypothetical protein [Aeromonas veronii]